MTPLEKASPSDSTPIHLKTHSDLRAKHAVTLTEPSQISVPNLLRNLSSGTPTLTSVKQSTLGYLVQEASRLQKHAPKTLSTVGTEFGEHHGLERTNTQPVTKSATRKKVPKQDDPTIDLIRYKTDGNAKQDEDEFKDSTQLHRYSKGQTKKPKAKASPVALSKIQERKKYEKNTSQSTRTNTLSQAASGKLKGKLPAEDFQQTAHYLDQQTIKDQRGLKRKPKSKAASGVPAKKECNLEETDYAIHAAEESEEEEASTEELFFVQPDLMEDDDLDAGSDRRKLKYPFLPALSAEHKQKHTLILDLDETLVHFMESQNGTLGGQFHVRPHAREFLQEMGLYFEVVIFTAAIQSYADWILDRIDETRVIKHRLYREHVSQRRGGVYIKDLSLLGRDIDRMIIVDNNPDNFQLQPENGIFIKSWFGDVSDTALAKLAPILREVGLQTATDVRLSLARVRESLAAERHKARRMAHHLRE